MTWSAIAICKCHWVARWISFSRHNCVSHRRAGGFYGQLAIADRGCLAQSNNSWRGRMRWVVALPRELSALSRISQGPILQRGREAPVWTELRQVMMGYFLPLLPLTVSWQQDNNLYNPILRFSKLELFVLYPCPCPKKICSILCICS